MDTRQTIASYPDYVRAQWAVDALADRDFAVDRLAIVGTNLQSFEQVTGKREYLTAAAEGATSGALVGLLVGWLLGLFSLVEPLVSALLLGVWGLVIGTVLGAVVGAAGHALTGGRQDFSSVSTLRAERYDVVADAEVADEARRALDDVAPARR